MNDPKPVILEFLSGLPVTIRELVTLSVAITSGAETLERTAQDPLGVLRTWIDDSQPATEGLRCAMICGAIEAYMAETEGPDFAALNEQTPSISFATMAAQEPLSRRHFANARTEFASLRAGPLSPASLRRWHSPRMA